MNTIINVECVDQELIITNSPTLASGGICENVVSFKFCSKWDGFSKTAVFYQNEKNVYYALIDSNNTCEIPYEVTLNEGTLHFGVFGVNGDTRRTSKVDKIRIHKGAWNKDMHPSDPTPDIYTQILSALNEANALLHSFLNGTSTTPVGNAKTLEGHSASYFATKETVDSIQTTSRATLSQAGWYRVAEYKGGSSGQANGALTNPCKLFIGVTMNGSAEIQLDSKNNSNELYVLNSDGLTNITKVRYTVSGNTAYLEVYARTYCSAIFKIFNGESYECKWEAITPTLTAETVDGVTVTTTYDIPSNATPVNSEDLTEAIGEVNLGRLIIAETALDTLGVDYDTANLWTYTATIHPSSGLSDGSYLMGGASYSLIGMEYGEHKYGYQMAIGIYHSTGVKIRFLSNGTWSDWYRLTTSSDLANYFKNTGGDINGDVTVKSASATNISTDLKNSVRDILNRVYADGTYRLYDITNDTYIILSKADGTNTFNGTASGCLPLDGTGEVVASNLLPLKAKNSAANSCFTRYSGKDGVLGFLGFMEANTPYVLGSDGAGVGAILHAKNYGDYNNFYKGLSVTDASGAEGGEIKFACPQTDHSFDGMITQDIFQNMMRIFATHDGKTKLFNIDFASMKEGGNEALHTGNSARVTITSGKDDVPDTMDGLWAY